VIGGGGLVGLSPSPYGKKNLPFVHSGFIFRHQVQMDNLM
jgi:hypothetical protein